MQDVSQSHFQGTFSSPGGRSICCPDCGVRFYARFGTDACPACAHPIRPVPPEEVHLPTVIGLDQLDSGRIIPSTITHIPRAGSEALGRGAHLVETADEFLEQLGARVHVYDLESLLGSGGMGRVYLARHRDLQRRCAVKVLVPRAARNDVDFVERFQEEGRAAAALNHPNIVVTHAIGVDRGFHFLEMEYVPGGSLRQMIRDEGPLPPIRATRIAQRIADGLALAHRRGIVHQDLKSDNIMLTLAGVPKISDFGLAKTLRETSSPYARTLAGTPQFMAPELFSGEPASPASDVYALGVIYFELLTGRVPFTGNSLPELVHAVQNEPLPNPRELADDLPLEMAECLAQMLEKCPANRPVGGGAAAQLLAAVAGHVRDLDSLLTAAFRQRPDVTWIREGSAYTLRIELDSGRKQDVMIEPNGLASSEKLLVISSVCGPAMPAYYEEALRLNGTMPHGGITIRESGGESMFCAVNTYPRETADPQEVRRSVFELAHHADAIEHLLTGEDQH